MTENEEPSKPTHLSIHFPLTGQDNYVMWRYRMVILLNANSMWTNSEGTPSGDLDVEKGKPTDTAKTINCILTNVNPGLFSLLVNSRNASSAWEKLKVEFFGSSAPNKLRYVREAAAIKFPVNLTTTSLNKTFSRSEDITRNLIAAANGPDIKISDLVALLTIAALPPQFNNVRAVIEKDLELFIGKEDEFSKLLNLEKIKQRVSSEMTTQEAQTPASTVLLTDTAKCSHGRTKSSCWTCDPKKIPTPEVQSK